MPLMEAHEHDRVRVLLVDDEDGIRRDYGRVLEAAGYRVDLASDGARALEALQRASYGVVVSDISMPGCDGIEQLCETELGARVIAEGVESTAERDTLLGAGVDLLQGFLLAKPAPSFQIPSY